MESKPEINGTDHPGAGCGGADAIGASLPPDSHGPDEASRKMLEAARNVCVNLLGPNAARADRAERPIPENYAALAAAGLLGMAIPTRYGGLDAPGETQRLYTEMLASYCGVTTFTQAQHHGSSRMVANGPNEALKQALLPDLAAGRRMSAISFAHLRRPGPPTLTAEPCPGGYRLNGKAPWVTGWGLMDQVVFGATLPNGRFVYVWSTPRRDQFSEVFDLSDPLDAELGSITASPPIPLCAMNGSATVELTLINWFVPKEHFLAESDRETMDRNDRNGVLGATAMPLGCATAALRSLCETAERRSIPAAARAAAMFKDEITEAKAQVEKWAKASGEAEFFENAVRVRAWCIELAVRTAHAAVTAASGSANSLDHPAQRLLREAMFYTIQAQTREVMAATLERLERRS